MSDSPQELAFLFDCGGEDLVGILHAREPNASVGVLIVTGGPQYRVGSHRQFVLLARDLASLGIPVMRFDYRGMGDSTGTPQSFDRVDDDLKAAIDAMFSRVSTLQKVVVWGLCDAASAAMIYGWRDHRVAGLVLANPWARTESGEAKALIKHYYVRRLFSGEFWRKLVTGQLEFGRSLQSLLGNVRSASGTGEVSGEDTGESFLARMEKGLDRFSGPVLFLLSGDDLTAAEFVEFSGSSSSWRGIMSKSMCQKREFPGVNHTFSSEDWRSLAARATSDWLLSEFTDIREFADS